MELSQRHLVQYAIAGDAEALTTLLARSAPAVRQALSGQIPTRWQSDLSVDDVMQETYKDAFLDIKQFLPQRGASFGSWLYRAAKRNLRDALRGLEAEKRGGHCRRVELDGGDDWGAALYELLFVTDSTPSRHAARDETAARLRQVIERLPLSYRKIIELFDLQERPMEEVAREVGCSRGGAFMRRKRAHRLLRELLGRASQYL